VSRVLKPGSRPFIVFGIIFGLLLCGAILIGLTKHLWLDAAKMAACLLAVYAFLCFAIGWSRIVVSQERLCFRPALATFRCVQFRDVTASVPLILLELDHPAMLQIYSADSDEPALQIPLKSFRREDVSWLLSLPQLRVQR
jgi:hypothetical protein